MPRRAVPTVLDLRALCAAAVGAALLFALFASTAGSASASDRECANAVLADWSDGKIDRVYPADCYLAALDALPEDLRAYTSAADDINRAFQASLRSSSRKAAHAPRPVETSRTAAAVSAPPSGLLGLAAVMVVVVVAGAAGFAIRRLRRNTS